MSPFNPNLAKRGDTLIYLDAEDNASQRVEYVGMTRAGLVAVVLPGGEISAMPSHWLAIPGGAR